MQHAVVVEDLTTGQQEVLVVVTGSQFGHHQIEKGFEETSADFQVLVVLAPLSAHSLDQPWRHVFKHVANVLRGKCSFRRLLSAFEERGVALAELAQVASQSHELLKRLLTFADSGGN